MRKRQAKKIEKKKAARFAATIRACMHRKPLEMIVGVTPHRGKSTLLNSVIRFVPAGGRAFTIEDLPEIQCQ